MLCAVCACAPEPTLGGGGGSKLRFIAALEKFQALQGPLNYCERSGNLPDLSVPQLPVQSIRERHLSPRCQR